MTADLEARFAELEALAQEYAKAQSDADYLDEFKKSQKALLMKKAEEEGFTTSAAQEREAYASMEYLELIQGLRAATEKALACKWKLTISQMRFEAWRTRAANRRAEINLR